jgi:HEAT repeat protein
LRLCVGRQAPPNSGLLRFAADAALASARPAQLKPGTLSGRSQLEAQEPFADWVALLDSEEVELRTRALAALEAGGRHALPALLQNLARPGASVATHVWTMMAVGRIGPSVAGSAHAALVACLSSHHPTIRRAAIRTLGELQDVHAVPYIQALRHDEAIDPSAWFGDDCSVGQTAELVLAALDLAARSRNASSE